jgi:nitrate/TMAO reductase-like tetraheme cytochrome c subunit
MVVVDSVRQRLESCAVGPSDFCKKLVTKIKQNKNTYVKFLALNLACIRNAS